MKKHFLTYLLSIVILTTFSQHTTIAPKENKSNSKALSSHKIMLIPFEPKLYMSEIDHNLNTETGMSAKDIKFTFRDGINDALFKAFKKDNLSSLDLMSDTVKYKKDLNGIYQYLSYEYQKTPNQENYEPPKKEKKNKTIEKGQLKVETNTDDRFMNAKITNAKVIPLLYAKYKTDVFVFINELDLKASGTKSPGDVGEESKYRKIVVHYTIYDLNATELNSGTAEILFEPTLNNPKKIISKHFSEIATTISQRLNKALNK
ncbi:MAG: hypothetical protein JSU07_01025 [Bacteroidetes bacterium]|nr:hypothetical protein [Bacteroidota bacterium]